MKPPKQHANVKFFWGGGKKYQKKKKSTEDRIWVPRAVSVGKNP